MSNAKRDENRITTLTAALNTDGKTIQPVYADPIGHYIHTADGSGGQDFSVKNAPRDENRVPVAMASSSNGTPVELYADSSGNLLIKAI